MDCKEKYHITLKDPKWDDMVTILFMKYTEANKMTIFQHLDNIGGNLCNEK